MSATLATLWQALRALRVALAIFRERRRLWAAGENEGTDVPVWHAQERIWDVVDESWRDPEGYAFRPDGEDEWRTAGEIPDEWVGVDGDLYSIAWRWETIPGAVFLTPEEADDWIDSQRRNYPAGLCRSCASCRRGSSWRRRRRLDGPSRSP